MSIHDATVEVIQLLVKDYGYIGIALAMFMQGIIQLIPAYLIMPLAGYFASAGKLDIGLVILSGTLGAYLANIALYEIGYAMGRTTFSDYSIMQGRYLTFAKRAYRKSQEWFDAYGTAAVFWCRFIPLLRTMISVVAGIEMMDRRKHHLTAAAGTFLYTAFLALSGWTLKNGWHKVGIYLKPIGQFMLPFGIMALLWWLTILAAERYVKMTSANDGNDQRGQK